VCKSLLVFHWQFDTMFVAYVVPFLRYSASKKGVTFKLGVGVVQGHWKWRRSIDHTTFYWSAIVSIDVLYHFQVIWRWIILTLKRSLKVIRTSTIRKLGCGFLFAFHSMAVSCIICKIKRDIGRKSWFFHITLAFDASVFRQVPVGILPSRLVWKTRMVGHGEKNWRYNM